MNNNVSPGRLVSSMRATVIGSAVVGIVLGLIALLWPGATLLTIAFFFGVSLIIAGLFRIFLGFSANSLPSRTRWLLGILGALVVIAGIICLADPAGTLVFLAVLIGIAWIFNGVHDLMSGFAGVTGGPRWMAIVAGVISIIAGIVVFTLPGLAIATFVTVGAILLIVVSLATLFALPRRSAVG